MKAVTLRRQVKGPRQIRYQLPCVAFIVLLLQLVFIQSAFVQNIKTDELTELVKEYESFCIKDTEETYWEDIKVFFMLVYEGSDVPPAEMLFLSNSIMILKSNFYSEDLKLKENRFFKYSLINNRLELISIDSRMVSSRWLDLALYHMKNEKGIICVDKTKKSITYDFEQNKILFSGFFFFEVSTN
jgi:hypothetical protein